MLDPAQMLGQVTWAGGAVAAVMALAEYGLLLLLVRQGLRRRGPAAAGRPAPTTDATAPDPRRPALGVGLALLAGSLAFPFAIASVQVPLQAALARWAAATLATADQYILSIPAVFASGLVQEPAKLLAAMVGMALAGSLRPGVAGGEAVQRAVLFGATAGVAFGGIEAAWVLSPAVGALGSVPDGITVGTLSLAVVERVFAVLFHLATAGLVVYAWSRGVRQGLLALGAMTVVHGMVNYSIVLLRFGAIGIAALEAWAAFVALSLFGILVFLARRARGRHDETGALTNRGCGPRASGFVTRGEETADAKSCP